MKAAKLSLTIPGYLMPMLELVLTPAWSLALPKGSMSALISNLLQKYLEEYFKTDILALIEYMESSPETSLEAMVEHFNDLYLLKQAAEVDVI